MPRRIAVTGVVFGFALDVVLGAILASLAPPSASAQASDDVVKIGVLTDMSGPAADATGPGAGAAARMAIEDFGSQVLGKPIELVSAYASVMRYLAAVKAAGTDDAFKVAIQLRSDPIEDVFARHGKLRPDQ